MAQKLARRSLLSVVIAMLTLWLISKNLSLLTFGNGSHFASVNPFRLITLQRYKSESNWLPYFVDANVHLLKFPNESPLVRLYLDVVRDTVCGLTLQTQEHSITPGIEISLRPFKINDRISGLDWPRIGITMVGRKRLIHIEWALRLVISTQVPGDFIECGVWRGGSSLFARAVLKALNITDRAVWLADSFEGLPRARTEHDNNEWSKQEYLKVPLEEVKTNFRAFNLLDDQVNFCRGFFVDSLPRCEISRIAVLRMDGDMYESTMDQLFNLYSKLQRGGVIIVDDYNIEECTRAIHDFRRWHGITDEIKEIPGDTYGRYWIKTQMTQTQMDRYKSLMGTKIKYTP